MGQIITVRRAVPLQQLNFLTVLQCHDSCVSPLVDDNVHCRDYHWKIQCPPSFGLVAYVEIWVDKCGRNPSWKLGKHCSRGKNPVDIEKYQLTDIDHGYTYSLPCQGVTFQDKILKCPGTSSRITEQKHHKLSLLESILKTKLPKRGFIYSISSVTDTPNSYGRTSWCQFLIVAV